MTRRITLFPQGRGRHPFDPDKTLRVEWADRPLNPADDPRDQDPDMAKPWEDQDGDDAAGVA